MGSREKWLCIPYTKVLIEHVVPTGPIRRQTEHLVAANPIRSFAGALAHIAPQNLY